MSVEISQTTIPNRVSIENSSISWRQIFAGTFISLLSYLTLMSLGIAIGSSTLRGLIQGTGEGGGLGIGSAIWLLLSILISVYIGSYVASRTSGLIPIRVGRTQGAVVTALFFGFFLFLVGSTLTVVGKSIGITAGALGGAAGDLSKNPQVQQTLRNALQGLNLRSSPEVVAQGLATRLLGGDQTGARDYLARQAGLSPTEATRRIDQFTRDLETTLRSVGGTTAQVISMTGWTLFGALVLGTLAGVLGGGTGANATLAEMAPRIDRGAQRGPKAA